MLWLQLEGTLCLRVPRDVKCSNVPRDVMPSIGSNSLPAMSNAPRDVMPSIGSNSLSARSSPRDVMSSSGRNSLPARPTVPMTNGQPTRNHSAPMEISFDEIFPNSSAPVHVELSYPMPWASSSPSVTCEGGSGWPPGAVFPGGGGCGAGGPGWPQGGGAPGWPQGGGGPGWPPGNGGPSGSERPGGSGSSGGQAVQGGRMAVQHRTQPTPVCYLCGEEGHDNPFCTKNREHASSCAKGNPSFSESILLKRKGDASKEGILLLQNNDKVSVCRDADGKCIEEVEYVSKHTAALHPSHSVPSRLCVTNYGGEYGFEFDDGLDDGLDVFGVPSRVCVTNYGGEHGFEFDDGLDDGLDVFGVPSRVCVTNYGGEHGFEFDDGLDDGLDVFGVPSRVCVTNYGGEHGSEFDDGLDPDFGPDVFGVSSRLCVGDAGEYGFACDDDSGSDDDGSDPDYTPHAFRSCLEGNKCGGAALEVVEKEQHDPFPYASGGDKGGAGYDDHGDPSRYTSPLGARFADAGVPQDPSHNIVGDVASSHHYRAGASVLKSLLGSKDVGLMWERGKSEIIGYVTSHHYRAGVSVLKSLLGSKDVGLMWERGKTEIVWYVISHHYRAGASVLRPLLGSKNVGLMWERGKTEITGYVDSGNAGEVDERRSISGHISLSGRAAISWGSKLLKLSALSTVEAESVSMCMGVQGALCISKLVSDYGEASAPVKILSDNTGALGNIKGVSISHRTKRIDVKYHGVRQEVEQGSVSPLFVHSAANLADMFTKTLPKKQSLRTGIG
jgi:hypothetical protein